MKNILVAAGALIIGGFMLQSCQTLSKEECAVADWNDLGIKDGRAGYPTSRIENHAKACQKINLVPDRAAYLSGHSRGITEFCTPANGLSFGLKGGYYGNSCPANLEPPFVQHYQIGSNLKQANDRVAGAQSRIERSTEAAFTDSISNEERAELRLQFVQAQIDLQRYQLEQQRAQLAYDQASAVTPLVINPPVLTQ